MDKSKDNEKGRNADSPSENSSYLTEEMEKKHPEINEMTKLLDELSETLSRAVINSSISSTSSVVPPTSSKCSGIVPPETSSASSFAPPTSSKCSKIVQSESKLMNKTIATNSSFGSGMLVKKSILDNCQKPRKNNASKMVQYFEDKNVPSNSEAKIRSVSEIPSLRERIDFFENKLNRDGPTTGRRNINVRLPETSNTSSFAPPTSSKCSKFVPSESKLMNKTIASNLSFGSEMLVKKSILDNCQKPRKNNASKMVQCSEDKSKPINSEAKIRSVSEIPPIRERIDFLENTFNRDVPTTGRRNINVRLPETSSTSSVVPPTSSKCSRIVPSESKLMNKTIATNSSFGSGMLVKKSILDNCQKPRKNNVSKMVQCSEDKSVPSNSEAKIRSVSEIPSLREITDFLENTFNRDSPTTGSRNINERLQFESLPTFEEEKEDDESLGVHSLEATCEEELDSSIIDNVEQNIPHK